MRDKKYNRWLSNDPIAQTFAALFGRGAAEGWLNRTHVGFFDTAATRHVKQSSSPLEYLSKMGYDTSLYDNYMKSITGSGMTDAEKEASDTSLNNQKELMQMQMDYNTEMDNTKIQRGVADAQAAGINPYALLGGAIGNNSATASSGSAPASTSTGKGGLSDMLNMMSTMMMANSDRINARTNQFSARAQRDIDYMNAETAKYQAVTDRMRAQSDINLNSLDATYREIVNAYLPQQLNIGLAQAVAGIENLLADTDNKQVNSAATAAGIPITEVNYYAACFDAVRKSMDNKLFEATFDDVVKGIKLDNQGKYYLNKKTVQDVAYRIKENENYHVIIDNVKAQTKKYRTETALGVANSAERLVFDIGKAIICAKFLGAGKIGASAIAGISSIASSGFGYSN